MTNFVSEYINGKSNAFRLTFLKKILNFKDKQTHYSLGITSYNKVGLPAGNLGISILLGK